MTKPTDRQTGLKAPINEGRNGTYSGFVRGWTDLGTTTTTSGVGDAYEANVLRFPKWRERGEARRTREPKDDTLAAATMMQSRARTTHVPLAMCGGGFIDSGRMSSRLETQWWAHGFQVYASCDECLRTKTGRVPVTCSVPFLNCGLEDKVRLLFVGGGITVLYGFLSDVLRWSYEKNKKKRDADRESRQRRTVETRYRS